MLAFAQLDGGYIYSFTKDSRGRLENVYSMMVDAEHGQFYILALENGRRHSLKAISDTEAREWLTALGFDLPGLLALIRRDAADEAQSVQRQNWIQSALHKRKCRKVARLLREIDAMSGTE